MCNRGNPETWFWKKYDSENLYGLGKIILRTSVNFDKIWKKAVAAGFSPWAVKMWGNNNLDIEGYKGNFCGHSNVNLSVFDENRGQHIWECLPKVNFFNNYLVLLSFENGVS